MGSVSQLRLSRNRIVSAKWGPICTYTKLCLVVPWPTVGNARASQNFAGAGFVENTLLISSLVVACPRVGNARASQNFAVASFVKILAAENTLPEAVLKQPRAKLGILHLCPFVHSQIFFLPKSCIDRVSVRLLSDQDAYAY